MKKNIMLKKKQGEKLMIKFYSTNCPKCKILEFKLKEKNIEYELSSNVEELIKKGFQEAPILYVDGEYLKFKEAIDWVNKR